MAKKHGPMTAKEVAKLLRKDGWTIKSKGPGDHVQWVHPSKKGKVTLDMGADPVPTSTLRSIFRQAGWPW